MNKKNVWTLVIAVALTLIISIGGSYAYFTAVISGSETNTTLTLSAGTMTITYSGGANINATNIYPSPTAWGVKTFTLTGTNTTDLTMKYKVSMVISANTFSTNAITYTLSGSGTGGSLMPNKSVGVGIATGARTIELGQGNFITGSATVHSYTLSMFFLDSGSEQNTDQGKTFTARLVTEAVQ